MSWTASAVISLPNRLSKRAIILVSLFVLTTVMVNMMMFVYIQYVNSYKLAKNYVNAEHEIMYGELSRAVATDDIYHIFTMINAVTTTLPYIDNIVVYDADGGYVADAKVLRDNLISDKRNVGIKKDLAFGSRKAGTVIYYISRMNIIEEVVMSISSLVMLNLIIVVTAALVGGYLSLRITKPVRDLSQHLQEINAPMHKSLEAIQKNKHRRSFRPKSGAPKSGVTKTSVINFRTVRRRK